tara:strand:- start:164 stop:391 length:228 start_codon:yes stop_codon:yes gene_type:complete
MVKHRLPLDDWFDDPPPPHPYDSWPSATYEGEWLPENGEEPPEIDEPIHEKMYRIATDKYNPFSIGGSESIHDFE